MTERFADVVVGAQLQSAHLIHVLVTSGEHEHRHVRDLADGLQDVEAVHARHRHVEQDNVWLLIEEHVQPRFAVGGSQYLGVLPL